MIRIITGRVRYPDSLFRDHYIEVKTFYAIRFDRVPCVTFIGELDVTAAFAFLKEQLASEIVDVFQHAYHDHEAECMFFNTTIFVLRNRRMVELSGSYCQLLHTPRQYNWASTLIGQLAQFRLPTEPAAAPATIVGFARQATFN